MSNIRKFDSNLWKELLSIEEEFQRTKKVLTGQDILSKFPDLSKDAAYAYLFALKNKRKLNVTFNDTLVLKKLESQNKSLLKTKLLLEQELVRAEERLQFMYAIQVIEDHSFDPIIIKPNLSLKEETTAIALLSDGHVDEQVDPDTVNGINEYNPEIAKKRIENFFSRTLYLINMQRRSGLEITNFILGILGDMISGYIHEELMESNSMSPTEATAFVQELLIRGIKTLYEKGEFKELVVVGIRGNHGRTSAKKKFKTGYKNSYEYLMYKNIEKIFTEYYPSYNIKFIIPKSEFAYIKAYDKVIRMSHMDHFNYQGGIGGVMIPLNRFLYKINDVIHADLTCGAHWHTYMTLPGYLGNGSVIGYNEYALGKGFKPEPPKMHFQLLDKRRGFTMNTPIYLNDF